MNWKQQQQLQSGTTAAAAAVVTSAAPVCRTPAGTMIMPRHQQQQQKQKQRPSYPLYPHMYSCNITPKNHKPANCGPKGFKRLGISVDTWNCGSGLTSSDLHYVPHPSSGATAILWQYEAGLKWSRECRSLSAPGNNSGTSILKSDRQGSQPIVHISATTDYK